MTLVDGPYQELVPDRILRDALNNALGFPVRGREWAVHLNCKSAERIDDLSWQRSVRIIGIDPDEQMIARAKARDHQSRNSTFSFLFAGGQPRDISVPVRLNYKFRCEPPDRTSIRSTSIQRVLWEPFERYDCDLRAVVDEICRFCVPGARVIIVVHGIVEVDNWAVNDVLGPKLRRALRLRRPAAALRRFGLVRVAADKRMYVIGKLDLAGVMRLIDETPEVERLLALKGWPATGYIHTPLRAAWGRQITKHNVRRSVAVFAGSVPFYQNESDRRRKS